MPTGKQTCRITVIGTLALALSVSPASIKANDLELSEHLRNGSCTAVRSNDCTNLIRVESARPANIHAYPKTNRRIKGPLHGSAASLDRQNEVADLEGLTWMTTMADLNKLVLNGTLVDLPEDEHIKIDPELPESRRYARLEVVVFLKDLAKAHARQFPYSEKLVITSAARPWNVQDAIMKKNKNASIKSVHPTGAAVDISYCHSIPKKKGKKGVKHIWMPQAEQRWIETILLSSKAQDLLEPIKEKKQHCYHIMVFKSYNKGQIFELLAQKK
jgi:hypothetical protein